MEIIDNKCTDKQKKKSKTNQLQPTQLLTKDLNKTKQLKKYVRHTNNTKTHI